MSNNQSDKLALKLFGIFALCFAAEACFLPYVAVYYGEQGIPAMEIGILSSVAALCAVLVQPVWSMLADRTGRTVLILRLVVLAAMISVSLFAAAKGFVALFFVNILYFSFQTCVTPLGNALAMNEEKRKAQSYSFIRMGGSLGYVAAAAVSGTIVKADSRLSFALTAGMYLMMFLIAIRIPEQKTGIQTEEKKTSEGNRKERLLTPQVLFVLLLACAVQVMVSHNSSFLGPYLVEMGYSADHIGYAMMFCALSELPVYFLANRIGKKVPVLVILLLATGALGVRGLLLAKAGSFEMVVLAQILAGISFMTFYYNSVIYLGSLVSEAMRVRIQSALVVAQLGIGNIIGNVGGGWLIERRGMAATYQVLGTGMIVFTIVMAILYFIIRRSVNEKK
ncbi:MFS transporter [Novisyntrophococcus fermenticellae]|uniref:MFS transporter n=1 Tax=Novisyntrophococcus fermenticellae TaxID=2068655 RepID=UPI001E43B92E|nr:MFS transporter [Novisyntrophococcus fermenticellae]